jgi:hypothetical protein
VEDGMSAEVKIGEEHKLAKVNRAPRWNLKLYMEKKQKPVSPMIPLPDMYFNTRATMFPAVPEFSLLHNAQTDSVAHSASYPKGTAVSFPGGKAAGT